MKKYTSILIVFLCVIAIFSAFQFISALREKLALEENLGQAQRKLGFLQVERKNLLKVLDTAMKKNDEISRKNVLLKEYLRAGAGKVRKLDSQFKEVRLRAEELNTQVSLLKTENAALRQDYATQGEKMAALAQENDGLKARLSSVGALKKAIKELKVQARHVVVAIKEKVKAQRLVLGNRGFLVKEGKSTYPARVKIEVNPAPADRREEISSSVP